MGRLTLDAEGSWASRDLPLLPTRTSLACGGQTPGHAAGSSVFLARGPPHSYPSHDRGGLALHTPGSSSVRWGGVIVAPPVQLSRGLSELTYMETSGAASGTWWVPRDSQPLLLPLLLLLLVVVVVVSSSS